MAEPLKDLIDEMTTSPLPDLTQLLQNNLTWERPRGDLYHWVPVLNRFDEILETQIQKYGFDKEIVPLCEVSESDDSLVTSILLYTSVLLEHCSNRSIYASSDRLYQLVLAPSISIQQATLKVMVCMGELFVQTSTSKYAAPKPIRSKIIQIAKSFPPPVPASSFQNKSEKDKSFMQLTCLDLLNPKTKYPTKWKLIEFHYFAEKPTPSKRERKKKSKREAAEKSDPPEGLTRFLLPEESVRKHSLQQIYDMALASIPQQYWFEFSLHARVAKAMNSKTSDALKLREALLNTKLIALAYVCCIIPNELDPSILTDLVQIILPESSSMVTRNLYFNAIKALECISLRRVWSSDLIRSLGGNVSHGVLFQCIRHIRTKIINEDDDCFEKAYIHLFNMIGNMIPINSLATRLAAGGLLKELLDFFNVKSKYRWTCSAATHLTTLFISSHTDSMADFVALGGFKRLIENIEYEVNFALENPGFGGGAPKLAKVYYTITFRQANYIRNMLQLTTHLIETELGDRLRNLFDSSILHSFNLILENNWTFGPLILGATIDAIFYIIHNEPTAFPILKEGKVVDTILDNYETLFMPSPDLLVTLPEVLGAICLNKDGLQKVLDSNAIHKYFQSFLEVKYAKELVRADMATNLGCSFDELGRHYPLLKPVILREVKLLAQRLPGVISDSVSGIKMYESDGRALYLSTEEIIKDEDGEAQIDSWETSSTAYVLDNFFFFLGGLLQDSGQWGKDAMSEIPFSVWLEFLKIKNTPYDYTNSNGFSTFMGVLKYFDDEDRNYGLPVLFEEIKSKIETPLLTDFFSYSSKLSYFSLTEHSIEQSTEVLSELNVLNTLLFALTETYVNPSFLFHERFHQLTDFFGAKGFSVLERIGSMLQQSIMEEAKINCMLPADVSMNTSPVFDILKESTPIILHPKEPGDHSSKSQEATNAPFKNTLQLRYLMFRFQNYAVILFGSLGKICMHKRQDFVQADWRRSAVEITIEIGRIFSKLVDYSEVLKQDNDKLLFERYFLSLTDICLYILVQKERNKAMLQTSLAMSFLQNGVLHGIRENTCQVFANLLSLPEPDKTSESTAEKYYISTDPHDILLKATAKAIQLLLYLCDEDLILQLPSGKNYFHQGYDNSPDDHLVSTFAMQCKVEALKLLDSFVELLKQGVIGSLQPPITKAIAHLGKQLFNDTHEEKITDFYPLDVKNVHPPVDQVNYLITLGMSEQNANHFFRHASHLDQGTLPTCPNLELNEDDWGDYVARINEDAIDFLLHYPSSPSLNEFKQLRADFSSQSFAIWNLFAKLSPLCISNIVEAYLAQASTADERENLVSGLMDEVTKAAVSFADNSEEREKLDISAQFLRSAIKIQKPKYLVYDRIADFTLNELQHRSENLNFPYFYSMLQIMEQVLCFKSLPELEPSRHNENFKFGDPYLLDDSRVKFLCQLVLDLKGLNSIDAAMSVTKILILLTQTDIFLLQVAKSNVLPELLKFSRSLDRERGFILNGEKSFTKADRQKNQEIYDRYHNALIVLFRRCFENSGFLKINFLVELNEASRLSSRSKRDLRFILRESSTLIFRQPLTFADVFSERYRLHNYDGAELTPTSLNVYRLSDAEIKRGTNSDVHMADSMEEDASLSDYKPLHSTGLVHLLISELMELSKTDWFSDPVDSDSKKREGDNTSKMKREFEVFKNPNFSYACFLLQTLTELLSSYKDAKLEFLTFSKKNGNELKPRSTALNFLLHQLLPTNSLQHSLGLEGDRRVAISSITRLAILGLVSTPLLSGENAVVPTNEDVDMAFIRKFFVDVFLKTLMESFRSPSSIELRYSKLIDQCELCGSLISSKFRETAEPILNKNATKHDQFYVARVFVDNNLPQLLSSLVGELDLNFPQIHKVMKACLKPVTLLGKIKTDQHDLFDGETVDKDDDEEVPEVMEEGDETPDLFKNSTLGMYDVEDESEDEMDYYDENGPLEVLMSGDEVSDEDGELNSSEEGSESSFDEDSDLNDDDVDEMDEVGDQDIEIIDELELDADDSGSNDSLGEDEDVSDSFSNYSGDFDEDLTDENSMGEEDESEYDEEDLDGWIEAFEDDAGDVSSHDNASSVHNADRDSHRAVDLELNDSGDEDEELSDDDMQPRSGLPSRTREREFTTFLDTIVPNGRNDDYLFFGDLFTRANRGNIARGEIHIGVHDNMSQFDRAFDSLIEMLNNPKRNPDNVKNEMYLKSTVERWEDTYRMFKDEVSSSETRIIPAILNRIEADSIELNKKRLEEVKKQREEREERLKKKAEEEKILREKEAREREERQNTAPPHEPVLVHIGDREVDISGTDIDPEFFEALPDDMREEVFTQHVRERRANATSQDGEAREIDPDFLDALPENIRDEILQQESMARRFSGLSDPRFDLADNDDDADEEDMQTARSIILPSSGLEIDAHSTLRDQDRLSPALKAKKSYATLLMGKSGVAAIIRLLFVPQPLVKRECIYQALHYTCNNKQSRTEVMNYLVALLYDGLNNKRPLDKLMAQIDNRVGVEQSKNTDAKNAKCPVECTPLTLGLQVIEAIDYLLERNNHVRYYICKEHENPFMSKKSSKKLRALAHLLKESKYPINLLLKLLENDIICENQAFVDILARVLQMSTKAISAFVRTKLGLQANSNLPYVPEHNVSQVIKILTAKECPNATFMRTIGAMQNLSVLPNAQKTFSLELSDKATSLGSTIIEDLNALSKDLEQCSDPDKGMAHSKAFSKFCAASSDQAKLLRILTALDYMFETKEKKEKVDEVEELTGLYKRLALGTLWDALSECLQLLDGRLNTFQITTALLPLIESLMVVCKHSRVNEVQVKDVTKYEARKVDFSKEPIESLFFSFTDEHKKILNHMVRTNPNLMSGPFGMLIRNPRVLEFDNKKNYFDRKLHEESDDNLKIAINVRRDQVFLDSYRALFFKSKDEVRKSKLEISFKGESGVDAGGVTREWYQVLSRQMFNPDYALFTPVASDETTFHPNRTSFINPEHLSFFKFIGMIIGKAIYDSNFLDCHFSRAVYKRLLGRPVSLKDMETLDNDYFKSLMWMLENDITDVITEDFSVETDDYGEHKVIDLIENGHNIPVTEENKQEYVKLVVEYRLQTSVAEQMNNFLAGFHDMIPKDLVLIFDEQELELLISGLPDIDVSDWKSNTEYHNYSPSSIQIQWFWRAVMSFDNEERAKLLQFATGTSKVPLNGFKELSGSNGISKFSIHRDYGTTDRLPSSHTCFNQIDLPAYETYETLRGSLLLAITEGHEGFGLA